MGKGRGHAVVSWWRQFFFSFSFFFSKEGTFTFSLPAVKVVQPYRVESTDGRARIQCVFHPHKNPEDLKVTLLRGLHGRQELCSFFLNLTGQTETHGGRQGRVRTKILVSFLGEYYVTEERKRQIIMQHL